MRPLYIGIGVAVAVVIALIYSSIFIVTPTQQALVLQFGEVRNAIREPGLKVKVPFIQDVLFLDKRILDLNIQPQEIIAADQKRLVVDAFARYRIENPVLFYQSVNNIAEGETRLSTFLQSSLRAVLADATFESIVRDDRPQLMNRIRGNVQAAARNLGIEVVDVKIRRADLPEANSLAIYRRMQTERQQEAEQIRAVGGEAARRIRAQADRESVVIVAQANQLSERLRGEGDALRSAIFAEAFNRDPAFFRFYRSMQAYDRGLQAGDTRLVISPDSEFFRYFNDPRGRDPLPPAVPASLPGDATGPGGLAPTAGDVVIPLLTDPAPLLPELDDGAEAPVGEDTPAGAPGDTGTDGVRSDAGPRDADITVTVGPAGDTPAAASVADVRGEPVRAEGEPPIGGVAPTEVR